MADNSILKYNEILYKEINNEKDPEELTYKFHSLHDDGEEKILLNIMNHRGEWETNDHLIVVSATDFKKHYALLTELKALN